ncbi:protein of unknown function DUF1212 [Penicillium expansum]|uniref:Threonine/serine exporter-like N-terminal domain-containing protein n=1 Tax=Penicillium expansum TaxID=27334 RepID=A0A0A2IGW3_PENEN|nr:protein of unknown function DUF1212 [Penicillium expansum]KGO42294.1 protein of unknown function DUF1212 [Penicillium expansum]KGO56336.1 protein of unknown function DUF1212 [Penicillium expansum]KGO64112.1 protein of unknown function DUF1212 [Penicillium expansum]
MSEASLSSSNDESDPENTSSSEVWQDAPQTSPQDEESSPHIRFRSNASFMQGARHDPPAVGLREEWDHAHSLALPHRPTMPYSHESEDITDTSLQDREPQPGETGGEPGVERIDQNKPLEDEKKGDEEKKDEKKEPEPPEQLSTREKWRAVTKNLRQKASEFGDRLGRPQAEGDDLTSGKYHADWATGGAVALSDMTDDKHKSVEAKKQHQKGTSSEAHRLVRDLTQDHSQKRRKGRGKPYPHAGNEFQDEENETGADASLRYRSGGGGILSQLIKLQGGQQQGAGGQSRTSTDSSHSAESAPSGAPTPTGPTEKKGKQKPVKWYKKPQNTSTSTLIGGGADNFSGASTPVSSEILSQASKRRDKEGGGGAAAAGGGGGRNMRLEDEIRVTVHIAEIICRQRYIMQLCRALMLFGAPTHRLEEYMQMTAKVLEVDSQFLYLPGCMLMSFDDPSTRTTEVKLVRVAQGIDLARLSDTHLIYKNVIHDVIGIEEAIQELDSIIKKKPLYNKIIIVLVYGLATATVGPFAFSARPIDMPIIFLNGILVGLMQHVAAPRSVLYSNVFEVTSTVVTSFLARAFGSIALEVVDGKPQYLFCFSAIAQSSIALILPGFLVLCSSLELQSHQIIAGSIRMVYALLFSLFIGYGITVGTTIYGLIDNNAVSDTSCPAKGAFKSPYVQRFPFVAIMTVWLLIINQGKWKQFPPMSIIALSGYISNYFSTKKLGSNSQVANTVGAFVIGIMGNMYSRFWHGHAATAILPGIFILVPSGLAATGSLISGVQSADEIRQNVGSHGSASSAPGAGLQSGNSIFSLGFGMIQVAIGITIGLFISALVVYPYGKARSGLFSF